VTERWTPESVDIEKPSVARVYDYLLGGAYNFAVDRDLADDLIDQFPDIKIAARANRDFVLRAIRHVTTVGIDQFIDIGCGLPTTNMVHQQARVISPGARVVYADNEPVAVEHGQLMLEHVAGAEIIQADMRHPDTILDHPVAQELLDFERPIAVLLAAVLHFVPDTDRPAAIVAALRDRLAPGSMLILSHGTADGEEMGVGLARDLYARSQTPASTRSWDQVQAFLAGWELIPPGLVWVPEWRPDTMALVQTPPAQSHFYGAVAIRR
jgi:SAM-dependent methyltransferase